MGGQLWKKALKSRRERREGKPQTRTMLTILSTLFWVAANGGVTNGGLRGVWPPFPEIGRNRPFPPFFCLFRPFPEGLKSTWKIQETEEKGLFPQISSDFLRPPSLKPPFVALQLLLQPQSLPSLFVCCFMFLLRCSGLTGGTSLPICLSFKL